MWLTSVTKHRDPCVTLALVHRYPKIAKVRKEKRRRQPLYLSLPLATRGPYCPRPGPAW